MCYDFVSKLLLNDVILNCKKLTLLAKFVSAKKINLDPEVVVFLTKTRFEKVTLKSLVGVGGGEPLSELHA